MSAGRQPRRVHTDPLDHDAFACKQSCQFVNIHACGEMSKDLPMNVANDSFSHSESQKYIVTMLLRPPMR